MPRTARLFLSVVASLLVGCGPSASDSGVEAPEADPGVPVLVREAVPQGMRGGAQARFVEEVRIGEPEEGEPPFYVAGAMAAGPEGTLYLHDPGAGTIRAFASDGSARGSFGSAGQGPGELSEVVTSLAVAADRLLAVDELGGRISVWRTDGEFLETWPFPTAEDGARVEYIRLWGFTDGRLAGLYTRPAAGGRRLPRFVVADERARPEAELARMTRDPSRAVVGGRRAPIPVVQPVAQAAHDPGGGIYLTAAQSYEVQAFEVGGERRWILRVDWPRQPMPEAEVDRALGASADMLRAMGEAPDVDGSSVENVPDRLPALGSVKVDGHGHLWVFPYVYWDPGEPSSLPAQAPADVYDAEGDRLWAGMVPARFALYAEQRPAWAVAWEDSVWGVETDPGTGAQSVVRYRLEEPF